jgi:hypothetical protein
VSNGFISQLFFVVYLVPLYIRLALAELYKIFNSSSPKVSKFDACETLKLKILRTLRTAYYSYHLQILNYIFNCPKSCIGQQEETM